MARGRYEERASGNHGKNQCILEEKRHPIYAAQHIGKQDNSPRRAEDLLPSQRTSIAKSKQDKIWRLPDVAAV